MDIQSTTNEKLGKLTKSCLVCGKEIHPDDDYCSFECKGKDKKPEKWYEKMGDYLSDMLFWW
jgi:hypothetical protein